MAMTHFTKTEVLNAIDQRMIDGPYPNHGEPVGLCWSFQYGNLASDHRSDDYYYYYVDVPAYLEWLGAPEPPEGAYGYWPLGEERQRLMMLAFMLEWAR